MAAARLEAPEFRTGLGIEREEAALRVAGEDDVAGGGKDACQERILRPIAPEALTGDRIYGVEVAVGSFALRMARLERAAEECLTFLGRLLANDHFLAPLE